MSDIDINKTGKDELAAYALGEFGEELDKTAKVDELRARVRELDAARDAEQYIQEAADLPPCQATHLRNPKNGRVFESTELLRERKDLVPCDKDGNPV